jgi:hypothetical protein
MKKREMKERFMKESIAKDREESLIMIIIAIIG